MMKENEKIEKIDNKMLFWSAFTAILTEALHQYGWIAFGIALVIIFVAIAGYNLIQADKEQKTKAEAEAKAKAEAEAKDKAEQLAKAEAEAKDKAEQLAKTLEEVKALKKQLQGSKKGGDE